MTEGSSGSYSSALLMLLFWEVISKFLRNIHSSPSLFLPFLLSRVNQKLPGDPKSFMKLLKEKQWKIVLSWGWLNVGDWVRASSEWLNLKNVIGHVYLIFSKLLKKKKTHQVAWAFTAKPNLPITINTLQQ